MQPSIIDDIGAIIGVSATMRLMALFGGTKLYIPETIRADHPIAHGIGSTAAAQLSNHFAREHIDLPEGEEFMRLHRVRRVASLLRTGMSPRDVGMLVGVSTRQAGNYRAEAERLGLLPVVFGGTEQ